MDHCPIMYQQPMQLEKFGKPFQFFNFMSELMDFMFTIDSIWSSFVPGNPILVLGKKIKHIKQALRELNKKFRNVSHNVNQARALLADTQDKINYAATEELLHQEQQQIQNINGALLTKEHFLLQKSRVKWLDKGDGNTGFFFNLYRFYSYENNFKYFHITLA